MRYPLGKGDSVSPKRLEKTLEWTCKLLLTAATVITAIAQLMSALK